MKSNVLFGSVERKNCHDILRFKNGLEPISLPRNSRKRAHLDPNTNQSSIFDDLIDLVLVASFLGYCGNIFGGPLVTTCLNALVVLMPLLTCEFLE